MTLHPLLLSEEQVKEIKSLLYAGHMSQPEIATMYKTHQAGISRIMHGHLWREIEWPNGTTGAIDQERCKVIKTSRKRSARYANPKQEGKPSDRAREILDKIHRITNSDVGTGESHLEAAKLPRSLVQRCNTDRTWDWIRRVDPYNSVVRQLELRREKNPTLKAAACFILSDIPINEWGRKSVIAAIQKLSHFIKKTA